MNCEKENPLAGLGGVAAAWANPRGKRLCSWGAEGSLPIPSLPPEHCWVVLHYACAACAPDPHTEWGPATMCIRHNQHVQHELICRSPSRYHLPTPSISLQAFLSCSIAVVIRRWTQCICVCVCGGGTGLYNISCQIVLLNYMSWAVWLM